MNYYIYFSGLKAFCNSVVRKLLHNINHSPLDTDKPGPYTLELFNHLSPTF